MTTETKTEIEPTTGDVWPPLAHITIKNRPVKPGDRALCGAKLMGIDLEGMHCNQICRKCEEIARSMRL